LPMGVSLVNSPKNQGFFAKAEINLSLSS